MEKLCKPPDLLLFLFACRLSGWCCCPSSLFLLAVGHFNSRTEYITSYFNKLSCNPKNSFNQIKICADEGRSFMTIQMNKKFANKFRVIPGPKVFIITRKFPLATTESIKNFYDEFKSQAIFELFQQHSVHVSVWNMLTECFRVNPFLQCKLCIKPQTCMLLVWKIFLSKFM